MVTKIDLKQITAGTALAGMKQTELASAAGLDPASLSRILSGDAQPRPETLDRIRYVLEARQIEFGPRSGVSLKDDYVRRLEGPNRYVDLHREILKAMIGRHDEVLFFNIDPSVSPAEIVEAFTWFKDADIKCRYLCNERPTRLDNEVQFYRALPDKYFVNQVQVVYSNYIAMNSQTPEDNIFIMNSPSIAAAERGKFDFLWDHCEPPKFTNEVD